MSFLLYLAGLLASAFTNVATGMNTTLGKASVEHQLLAALAIQAIGTIALFVTALVGGGFSSRPTTAALVGMPWWAWVGGGVQAITVFSVLVAAGAAGTTLFSALTVTGGTVAALALDHYGLLGFEQHDASWLRIGGRVAGRRHRDGGPRFEACRGPNPIGTGASSWCGRGAGLRRCRAGRPSTRHGSPGVIPGLTLAIP